MLGAGKWMQNLRADLRDGLVYAAVSVVISLILAALGQAATTAAGAPGPLPALRFLGIGLSSEAFAVLSLGTAAVGLRRGPGGRPVSGPANMRVLVCAAYLRAMLSAALHARGGACMQGVAAVSWVCSLVRFL